MKKDIGIIGVEPVSTEIIKAIIKAKEMNDLIIVSGTSYPDLKPQKPFEIKPMPIIPEIKSGYKDGQTSRRNRRKRERKR